MAENRFGRDNWTGTGVNDSDSLAAEIDRIKKWQRTHSGIDFAAAGPDYPHPSQKVRTLHFFEGAGRLDSTGIQLKDSDPAFGAGNNPGIFWVTEYTETPVSDSSGSLYGDTGTDISQLYMLSRDASHEALVSTSVDNTLTNNAIVGLWATTSSVTASAELVSDPVFGNTFRLDNASLRLDRSNSDFPATGDGQLWYRADLDKFRARANGVTESLAFESSIPTTMNKQPFAAKTTTYVTTASDGVISVDASSASFTVTLVTAVGNSGLTQTFKKINAANVVTIDASSTQTIDGALTYALSARYSFVTLVSDGAGWLIVAQG